eukprot:12369507-Ditylum_brightwellii.AAC.1
MPRTHIYGRKSFGLPAAMELNDETAHQQLKMTWYKIIIETMFHLKDHLTVSDHQYMFQSLQEVEEFLHTRSAVHIKDWIVIWYIMSACTGIKECSVLVVGGDQT